MKRIYLNQSLSIGQTVKLTATLFHYLCRVLRCRVNENIIAFNGNGYDYHGVISSIDKRQARFIVQSKRLNSNESPLETTLIQGLSKGERMDIALQKAVELGVNTIYPVETAFNAVKMDEKRREKKWLHWQSIVISACQQSGRSTVPMLHPIQPLEDVIPIVSNDLNIMLHPYTEQTGQQKKLLTRPNRHSPSSVTLLVGPEGGLSPSEVNLAYQNNFLSLRLGKRILRTETATISALSIVQLLWGDWHV